MKNAILMVNNGEVNDLVRMFVNDESDDKLVSIESIEKFLIDRNGGNDTFRTIDEYADGGYENLDVEELIDCITQPNDICVVIDRLHERGDEWINLQIVEL